jgi:hypothetical protein
MVSHKYYIIYMTYQLRASWCPGSLAESDGSLKALHPGAEFG